MKQTIIKLLKKELKLSEKQIENLIEIPPNPNLGDYSFPCFILSKTYKKSPDQIAENLRKKIKLPKELEQIQALGPYLNFFINKKLLAQNIVKEILTRKDKYGKSNIGKSQKILIEHTSINPNASPHVGRARNAIIGDSITRIIKFVNFKPEVHYYVNNVSKQIAMLVLANADKLKFQQMLKEYIEISSKVEKSKRLEQEVFDLLNKFEKGDKTVTKKFKKITDTCVKGQKEILKGMGIEYDSFDYESDYLKDSTRILNLLKKSKKLFKDSDGRLVLNQTGTKIEKKMKAPFFVLTRSDNTGLYPLRDISYTIYKNKIAKDNLIVLGEDQKLYFEQLTEALKLLKITSPKVIHYSFILLGEKDRSKKMSTRKGTVVLLEDFLNKAIKKSKQKVVGIGAVKYSILKNNPNKSIFFDLDEALSFEGDTGPYLQYSYARASSILKKAKSKQTKNFKIKTLKPKEIELTKKLAQFPEVVLSSYNNLNPSHIANYSYQLAKVFSEFYHDCPVINSDNENFRLALVQSFRYVLKNSLSLLGIDVLERM